MDDSDGTNSISTLAINLLDDPAAAARKLAATFADDALPKDRGAMDSLGELANLVLAHLLQKDSLPEDVGPSERAILERLHLFKHLSPPLNSGESFLGTAGRAPRPNPDMMAALGVGLAGRVLPRDSWPVLLGIETVRFVGGKNDLSKRTVDHLFREAPDTGPLACFVTSLALDKIGERGFARAFARKGLSLCKAEHFRNRDMARLLADNTDLRRVANALCTFAASLTPEELADFSPTVRPLFKAALDAPAGDRLDALLDAAWEAGLGDWLKQQLLPLAE